MWGGRTRIQHRNLLLPLQDSIRQLGGLEVEDLQNADEEEDENDGMPGVTRVPQVRTRRRNITPLSSPIQHLKASGKDASADLKSRVPSDFRQFSDMLDGESSEEDELYTDSLTSHHQSLRFYNNRKFVFPSGPYIIQSGRPQYSKSNRKPIQFQHAIS